MIRARPSRSCRRPGRRTAQMAGLRVVRDARSAVYVQTLRTRQRSRVSARAGINGAPACRRTARSSRSRCRAATATWTSTCSTSPRQELTRLTDDPAIDTEPAWSPDGTTLYFTSDRSGGPQIYRVGARRPASGRSASPSTAATTRGRAFRRTASSSRCSRSTRRLPHRVHGPAASGNCTVLSRAARTNRRASRRTARC